MEKEIFFFNSSHLLEQRNPPPSDHLLQPSFLDLNWDQSVDHTSHYGSSLSSMVSSPTTQTPPDTVAAPESVALGELIGRLGSICNSGEISSQSLDYHLSGYCNEPLNSPQKLHLPVHPNLPISGNFVIPPVDPNHLAPFSANPVVEEGAARFPRLGAGNCGEYQMAVPVSYIPVTHGSQMGTDMRSNELGTPPVMSGVANGKQFCGGRGELLAIGHTNGGGGGNTRKRKASEKGRAKEFPRVAEEENLNAKRSRSSEVNGETQDDGKPKAEPSNSTNSGGNGDLKQEKENNPGPSEPPKQDYIHVRARRGQATDNHSLAERVRREKISERMKFLQDLVPGCNKVTGKAVMLDEIINYVQSLQCQVEFLSMKLASVNHRMEFNMESFLQKENHQPRWSLPCLPFPSEISAPILPFAPQPSQTTPRPMNPLESNSSRKSQGMQFPTFDGSGDFNSEVFWNNDLQDVVQMTSAMNQEASCPSLEI